MKHQAYCNGNLVAVVSKNKHKQWIIEWPSRGWAKERIADVEAAKEWVGSLLHGKLVTWMEVTGDK